MYQSALVSDLLLRSLSRGRVVFCGSLWCWSAKSHLNSETPQSCKYTSLFPTLHTHKHTHRLFTSPVENCCSVPTYCGGYKPENKFGKLEVRQGQFPTDVLKLFQKVGDLCPALLSPTGLPSGLSSICHIQRNADAAISGSTITARSLLFVCKISLFTVPPV